MLPGSTPPRPCRCVASRRALSSRASHSPSRASGSGASSQASSVGVSKAVAHEDRELVGELRLAPRQDRVCGKGRPRGGETAPPPRTSRPARRPPPPRRRPPPAQRPLRPCWCASASSPAHSTSASSARCFIRRNRARRSSTGGTEERTAGVRAGSLMHRCARLRMTWCCRGLGLPGGHVCANAARSSLHSAHVAPIVGRLAALPNLDRHQIPMNTSTPTFRRCPRPPTSPSATCWAVWKRACASSRPSTRTARG